MAHVLALIEADQRSRLAISERAGVSKNCIGEWSSGADAMITNVEAVLGALGYELYVRQKGERK